MLSRGYISSKNDYYLFTKSTSTSLVVFMVYVDDILLAGSYLSEMNSLKSFLDQQFKIKDLGLIHYFLGLEVIAHDSGYLITQQKYVSYLLDEFSALSLLLSLLFWILLSS